MRRGKGDEKVVGPLFPRLHVNDTAEKGGPRAPPRNKMALYEELSVPFQRFNPNSTSSNGLSLSLVSLGSFAFMFCYCVCLDSLPKSD